MFFLIYLSTVIFPPSFVLTIQLYKKLYEFSLKNTISNILTEDLKELFPGQWRYLRHNQVWRE